MTDNLQEAINTLAPKRTVTPRKQTSPWINDEFRLLISKRDATNCRYGRTRSQQLLDEFLDSANLYGERNEAARCAYMHNRIGETLDNWKNFWKKLRNFGLVPKASDALYSFIPDEINDCFSSIVIFPHEDSAESFNILMTAPSDGFSFSSVPEPEVILAVLHFKTQVKGEDGIHQSIVAKALPVIASFLTRLFNTSHANGFFPPAWKKAWIIALKKVTVLLSMSDFWPISLPCFLAKVLEKLINICQLAYDQVVDCFAKKKKKSWTHFKQDLKSTITPKQYYWSSWWHSCG